MKSSYLSARVRNFLAQSDSSQAAFKPFLNERDSLNRLIDSPRPHEGPRKDQSVLDVLKRIEKMQRKSQSPNVCLQLENTFDSSSLMGPFGLFKKKSNEMKRIKKRIVPTNKQKYEQDMVLYELME